MPPHIFKLAARAFSELQLERRSQAILVSGESGAGKTETTKAVLKILSAQSAATAGRGVGGSDGSDLFGRGLEARLVTHLVLATSTNTARCRYLLATSHCSLLTTYCLLLAFSRRAMLPLATCYLLLATCHLLPTTYLLTAYYLLSGGASCGDGTAARGFRQLQDVPQPPLP